MVALSSFHWPASAAAAAAAAAAAVVTTGMIQQRPRVLRRPRSLDVLVLRVLTQLTTLTHFVKLVQKTLLSKLYRDRVRVCFQSHLFCL